MGGNPARGREDARRVNGRRNHYMTKGRRAAIYARYSTHGQRSESIEIQLDASRAYCSENGLMVVAEYCDHVRTGTTTDRAEFQRMMADAWRGLFDYVVIYKVTRIMRNRDEMAMARIMLRRSHVEMLYAGELAGIEVAFSNIWAAIEPDIASPGGKERIEALRRSQDLLREELAVARAVEAAELDRDRVLFWFDAMARGMDDESILRTLVSRAVLGGQDGGNGLRIAFTFDSPFEGEAPLSEPPRGRWGTCSRNCAPGPANHNVGG